MGLGKQAKILSEKQASIILNHLETTRYPLRDRVMFLLSSKAGLRAKEISLLTWRMVTDASGDIAEYISLPDTVSKGKNGGRIIPLNSELKASLVVFKASLGSKVTPTSRIIHSERAQGMTTGGVTVWFHRLYAGMGYDGCSSHSGRRTFITKAANKIIEAGGSLRDIQQLVGHSDLSTTQKYIEGNTKAKATVVDLI